MEMSELQKKNDAELIGFVKEKREELRKLRFGVVGAGQRNTRAIRTLRHTIARALTEVTKREKEMKITSNMKES
jgi:ribosomal protein L29